MPYKNKEDKKENDRKIHQRTKHKKRCKKYGITEALYNELFTIQNGSCKICGVHQSELNCSLSIDHDHRTQKVRGLLCPRCNCGIGYFHDDIHVLKRAISYLETK